MNKRQIDELLKKTGQTFAKAKFLPSAISWCENYYDSPPQQNERRVAVADYLRCIKKALYFTRQTLCELLRCLDDKVVSFFRDGINALDGSRVWDSEIPYSEEVIYNFDAFVFSARTLFEPSLVESLKTVGDGSYEYIEKLAESYFRVLTKPSLSPIRNEVVHYNYSGSTSAYTASIKKTGEGWDISIDSNFMIKGQSECADLLLLLSEITDGTTLYAEGIIGVILGSYYQLFGQPTEDQGYQWDEYTVKLSDYEVPNFDVRFE